MNGQRRFVARSEQYGTQTYGDTVPEALEALRVELQTALTSPRVASVVVNVDNDEFMSLAPLELQEGVGISLYGENHLGTRSGNGGVISITGGAGQRVDFVGNVFTSIEPENMYATSSEEESLDRYNTLTVMCRAMAVAMLQNDNHALETVEVQTSIFMMLPEPYIRQSYTHLGFHAPPPTAERSQAPVPTSNRFELLDDD